jgi:hypothetical protein
MSKAPRLLVAACAAGLYAACLVLPAAAPFNPNFNGATYPGYVALGAWKARLYWEPWDIDWWILGTAWFANPAIWFAIAFVLGGHWRAAGIAGGCGLLLSLVVLPRFYEIVAGLPGYWTWVGSAGLLLASSAYTLGRKARRTRRCT